MSIHAINVAPCLQGEEERGGPSKGVEAGLENDFACNNNVAGASKHVRLGEALNVTSNG